MKRRRTLGEQSSFPFARKPKSGCGMLLDHWARVHGVPVRSTASVRTSAENKRAPHSEMCLHTRCAGKPVRAFAKSKYGAAIVYMDKGVCHFTSGTTTEVLPPAFWRAAGEPGFSGARKRKRSRR